MFTRPPHSLHVANSSAAVLLAKHRNQTWITICQIKKRGSIWDSTILLQTKRKTTQAYIRRPGATLASLEAEQHSSAQLSVLFPSMDTTAICCGCAAFPGDVRAMQSERPPYCDSAGVTVNNAWGCCAGALALQHAEKLPAGVKVYKKWSLLLLSCFLFFLFHKRHKHCDLVRSTKRQR